MALIRWEMSPLPEAPSTGRPPRFVPATDVVVGDGDVVLTMDLPGLGPADVTIEIQDSDLTIRGQRTAPAGHEAARFAHRERAFGAFERHVRLPDGVDPDAITAAMDQGVLSLLMPRPARPEPRRISIGPEKPRRFSLDGISAELVKAPRRRATR